MRELIPSKARLVGYLVFAVLSVLNGAVLAGFAAAAVPVPVAIVVAGAVLANLATAPLLVAAFHLDRKPAAVFEPRRAVDAEAPVSPVTPALPAAEAAAYAETWQAEDNVADSDVAPRGPVVG